MKQLISILLLCTAMACTSVKIPEVPHGFTGQISDTSNPNIRRVSVEGRGDDRDTAMIDGQMVAIAAVVRRVIPSKHWTSFDSNAKEFYKHYSRYIRGNTQPQKLWVDGSYTYVKFSAEVDQQALERVLEELGFLTEREEMAAASVVVVPEKEVMTGFAMEDVRQSIATVGEMLAEKEFEMIDTFQESENRKSFNDYWTLSGRKEINDMAQVFADQFGADVIIKFGVTIEKNNGFYQAAVNTKSVIATTSVVLAQTTGHSEEVKSKSLALAQALRNAVANSIDQMERQWRKHTAIGVPYKLSFIGDVKGARKALKKAVKKLFKKTKQKQLTKSKLVYTGYYKGDRDDISEKLAKAVKQPWKIDADIEVGNRFEFKVSRR